MSLFEAALSNILWRFYSGEKQSDLAASWPALPQDCWRHRSPAAGCRALAGLLPLVTRVAPCACD
jgi:hypothetical protein